MTYKVRITCDYELEVDAEDKNEAIELAITNLQENPQFEYEVEEVGE